MGRHSRSTSRSSGRRVRCTGRGSVRPVRPYHRSGGAPCSGKLSAQIPQSVQRDRSTITRWKPMRKGKRTAASACFCSGNRVGALRRSARCPPRRGGPTSGWQLSIFRHGAAAGIGTGMSARGAPGNPCAPHPRKWPGPSRRGACARRACPSHPGPREVDRARTASG